MIVYNSVKIPMIAIGIPPPPQVMCGSPCAHTANLWFLYISAFVVFPHYTEHNFHFCPIPPPPARLHIYC